MLMVLIFATIFALSLGVSFIPTFLEDVRGVHASVITVMSAGAAVGSAGFGLAVARIRRLQRAPFVVILLAIAISAVGFVIFRSTAILPLIAIGFVCRGGFFTAWAMHTAALGELTPEVHRSRAFALMEMTGGVAYSFGPMVAGPLYAYHHTLAFDAAIACSLLLLPVMLLANRRAQAMHRALPMIDGEPSLAA
jgi:MFS family permease